MVRSLSSRPVIPWMMNVVFLSTKMDMSYAYAPTFSFSTARRNSSVTRSEAKGLAPL